MPRRRSPRRNLRALADRLGIIAEYRDQTGRHLRRTADETREALLALMGYDAPTEDAAEAWLAELDHAARTEIVPPVRVVRRDHASARHVAVRLPPGAGTANVSLTIVEEAGHVWRVDAAVRRRARLALPTRLPYGYHHVEVEVRGAAGEWRADQSLIVVPDRCAPPQLRLRMPRAAGLVANLYSVRREQDWGVGDSTTLLQLVEWSGARRLAFVGVNPLHALYNRGFDISPYSPVSRLFRNPLYLDVDRVPELAHAPAARALLESTEMRAAIAAARARRTVDYDGVIALKMRALAELHRAFRESRASGARARAYAEFVRAREPQLTRFAAWMTLAEQSGTPDWRAWPAELRDPGGPAVAAFMQAHAERVDLHRWLQFELDRQLAEASERARVLDMDVGIYQDLAIGTSRGGSDTWSYPELFVTGAAQGAPPDPYAAAGQNWGLPPMNPHALRAQRYGYWIQLLRHAFEHAGALRIDHVMGLFRAFWIPDGWSGEHGAYVRFPAADLLGILALESVRHDAIVVGEDLGTVPREVPRALARWGILSSKVLLFERDARGFKPARRYPALALATANTHDLPTLGAFWGERDIVLRAQVGLLSETDVPGVTAERRREKKQLLRRIKLAPPRSWEQHHFERHLAGAVHEFLCSTPARLVGLSFDDLTGETEPVNVPGVGPERYPSWRRRSRMTLEEASWSFEVDDAIRCTCRRAPR